MRTRPCPLGQLAPKPISSSIRLGKGLARSRFSRMPRPRTDLRWRLSPKVSCGLRAHEATARSSQVRDGDRCSHRSDDRARVGRCAEPRAGSRSHEEANGAHAEGRTAQGSSTRRKGSDTGCPGRAQEDDQLGIREELLTRQDNPVGGMEDNLPKKRCKERVLSIDEARIAWRAAATLGYPMDVISYAMPRRGHGAGEICDSRARHHRPHAPTSLIRMRGRQTQY